MGQNVLTLTPSSGTAVSVDVGRLATHIATDCSFIHYYDAAETERDDRIHPQDWALPALLQAPWRAADPYARILQVPDGGEISHWKSIEAYLAKVGTGWSLEDPNAEVYAPAVLALMQRTMTTPWVKAAVATKLLHKKRPNLIPVIDRELWAFYKPSDLTSVYPSATQVCEVIFGSFFSDLRRPQNHLSLTELQHRLVAHGGLPAIGRVRLLEMAVWLVRSRSGSAIGVLRPNQMIST